MQLPHLGVYTRLRPSAIHGIGVFAIIPIPAGTYIFEPDESEMITVNTEAINDLPDAIRQLYQAFCPVSQRKFQCPLSFNNLTPSWFLNHSSEPNVAADEDLKFYALRNIAVGEELTSDYRTYTDSHEGFD